MVNMDKCPKKFRPNLSTQAQKFGIFEKSSLWVSVVRHSDYFSLILLFLLHKFNLSPNSAQRISGFAHSGAPVSEWSFNDFSKVLESDCV